MSVGGAGACHWGWVAPAEEALPVPPPSRKVHPPHAVTADRRVPQSDPGEVLSASARPASGRCLETLASPLEAFRSSAKCRLRSPSERASAASPRLRRAGSPGPALRRPVVWHPPGLLGKVPAGAPGRAERGRVGGAPSTPGEASSLRVQSSAQGELQLLLRCALCPTVKLDCDICPLYIFTHKAYFKVLSQTPHDVAGNPPQLPPSIHKEALGSRETSLRTLTLGCWASRRGARWVPVLAPPRSSRTLKRSPLSVRSPVLPGGGQRPGGAEGAASCFCLGNEMSPRKLHPVIYNPQEISS